LASKEVTGMGFESIAIAGMGWMWDQYGKSLADKAISKLSEQWKKFHWNEAESKYRARLQEQHSTTRLLGHPKPITVSDIFTDVYVFDMLTAWRRYDFSELRTRSRDRDSFHLEEPHRKSVLRIVASQKRLYILGKPGSGKTTLLKYLTMQACSEKIAKTPIFVSLKDWSDSAVELISYIAHQFEICGFPDSKAFIAHILKQGNVMVLFDGLDEVNQEGSKRARMISVLTDFAKQYPEIQIILTCRIAATDYSFTNFTYLEIADFNERQKHLFALKWYQDDETKYHRFIFEFQKPENEGFRELARTPLLMALLCLAFDETLTFPPRRVELYKEALDALLKKWDSSRNITRDVIYRKLSPGRKDQMLARIAAENMEADSYLIPQETLEKQIYQYLQTLPTVDIEEMPDGEAVLKAIEMQHGILVEVAHGIHSFSHLTFQEYFTSRYIFDNAADGAIKRLIRKYVAYDKWREVILLVASLLDNADTFFEDFLKAVDNLISDDMLCKTFLQWVRDQTNQTSSPTSFTRAAFIYQSLLKVRELSSNQPYSHIIEKAVGHSHNIVNSLTESNMINEFRKDISEGYNVLFTLRETQAELLASYLGAVELLLDCLKLAATTNRRRIEKSILLPPKA
jgi:energy-coupling factor transporter ATP-binding protein EcfA2